MPKRSHRSLNSRAAGDLVFWECRNTSPSRFQPPSSRGAQGTQVSLPDACRAPGESSGGGGSPVGKPDPNPWRPGARGTERHCPLLEVPGQSSPCLLRSLLVPSFRQQAPLQPRPAAAPNSLCISVPRSRLPAPEPINVTVWGGAGTCALWTRPAGAQAAQPLCSAWTSVPRPPPPTHNEGKRPHTPDL